MKRIAFVLLLIAIVAPPALAEDPRPAESLKFVSYTGETVSLEGLRGKPVLIMFFATTCPHCQNTADKIAPIYKELAPRGIEVIGLAMDENAQKNLPTFIENHAVKFPVAVTSRQEFSRFSGVSVMARWYYPYLFFVDKNGLVRKQLHGGDRAFFADLGPNIYQVLTDLLAEKPTS